MDEKKLDRISQGYKGELGAEFQKEIIRRVDWVCNNVRGKSILDVGCSQGIVSILLGEKGKKVTGIDKEMASIEYAINDQKYKSLEDNVTFICDDFIRYPFEEKFDCIIMGEILEHVYNPGLFLDRAKELLKDDGRLIVTVPFGINPFPDHMRTYYFAELFNQISERVAISDVMFFGHWIGYIADNNSNNIDIDYSLVCKIEDSFFQVEEKKQLFIDELKKSIEELKSKQEKYIAENGILSATIEKANKETEKLSNNFAEMNKTALRFKKNTEIITIENKKLKEEIVELKQANQELESKKKEILTQANQTKEKFNLLQGELADIELSNKSLKKILSDEREKLTNIEEQNCELNSDIAILKENLDKSQEEFFNVKEELENLKIEYKKSNDVSYKRRKSLEYMQKKFNEMNTVAYKGKKDNKILQHQKEVLNEGYEFYREAYENLISLRGIKLWMKLRNLVGKPYMIARKDLQLNLLPEKTTVIKPSKQTENKIVTAQEKYEEYERESINKEFYDSLEELTANISKSNGSGYYKKADINVGIITDEFMYNYYKDSVNLRYISPDNYKDEINNNEIDFILFVSCWHGMFGREDYSGEDKRSRLCEMLKYARAKGVTIIFQSIEDPTNYNVFINIAKEADYIFTTDINVIEKYKKDTGNDQVYYLGYGVNPQFHNPISSFQKRKNKNNKVFFAGSWADRYPERCRDMRMIFNGVLKSEGYDLLIADRNMNINGYAFPNEYSKYLIPPIEHSLLQKVHKLFDYTINLNTITNSPTMCAMRVYEIQALGGLLISNYALAVSSTFPGIFTIISEDEVEKILNNYSEDEVIEMQIDAIREVFSKYTVFDRLNYIFEKAGIKYKFEEKKVYIIYETLTDNLKKSFEAQKYENKELISKESICNQDNLSGYFIVFKDKIYNKNYIVDLINATKYTDTEYINYCNYKDNDKAFEYTDGSNTYEETLYDMEKVNPKDILIEKKILKTGFSIPFIVKRNIEDKKKKELAVIIPTYNNGRYLKERAIRSLVRSSIFDRMQIYIIDDGSDKETLEYIDEIKEKYDNVTTFCFNDGGSGSASRPRNKGLEISKEPFITYLDPDNEAINDGYSKLLDIVKSKNYDFAFGYIDKIDDTIQPLCFRYESFSILNPREELIGNKFKTNSIQACVVRRDLIVENDIKSPEGAIGQDTMFFYELMLNAKKAYHLYEPIHIYYAERATSVVNTIGKSFFDKSYLMEKYQVAKLKEYEILDEYKNIKLNQFIEGWYKSKLKKVLPEDRDYCDDIVEKIIAMYEG